MAAGIPFRPSCNKLFAMVTKTVQVAYFPAFPFVKLDQRFDVSFSIVYSIKCMMMMTSSSHRIKVSTDGSMTFNKVVSPAYML